MLTSVSLQDFGVEGFVDDGFGVQGFGVSGLRAEGWGLRAEGWGLRDEDRGLRVEGWGFLRRYLKVAELVPRAGDELGHVFDAQLDRVAHPFADTMMMWHE